MFRRSLRDAALVLLAALAIAAPARAGSTRDPLDVATQLLNYAEVVLPGYFPQRRPTLSLPPFRYRYYPTTGIYLGVVVDAQATYQKDGVYVMGGQFGAAPLYVGQVDDYIAAQPSPDLASRIAAATASAQSDSNACSALPSFYWEIGDVGGARASGSVRNNGSADPVFAGSTMSIASASKWLYGGWVAQQRGSALSSTDIKFLTFRSGYASFGGLPFCSQSDTVAGCLEHGTNGAYNPAYDGMFFYDSGHMQQHAARPDLGGLGPDDATLLSRHIRAGLGGDVAIDYQQPQLAGGGWSSANGYTSFLRKVLSGQLHIAEWLGTNRVCTNPVTCPNEAIDAPVPLSETWHYSIAHWVEDDPVVGDGAFSSPGAFGFYPWIDAGSRWYGVLARSVAGGSRASVVCGRLVRKAWLTGVAQ